MVIHSKKPSPCPPASDAFCYPGIFAFETRGCCSPGEVRFPSSQPRYWALLGAPSQTGRRSPGGSTAAPGRLFRRFPGRNPSSELTGEKKRAMEIGKEISCGLERALWGFPGWKLGARLLPLVRVPPKPR